MEVAVGRESGKGLTEVRGYGQRSECSEKLASGKERPRPREEPV